MLAPSVRQPFSDRLLLIRRAETGIAGGIAAALLMGLPTDVIPNPWFTRMTPVRPLDVVLLALTALLLGALAATYVGTRERSSPAGAARGGTGGLLSAFAIGCPVCNKLVVAMIGTSGAVTWFGPLQPALGAAGVALAASALYVRLRTQRAACAVRPG